MSDSPKIETRLSVLRQAMMRRIHRRLVAEGWMTLPAVPAARDVYAKMLGVQFESMGRALTKDEDKHLRNVLEEQLGKAFAHSPHARIRIDWKTDDPPPVTLTYNVRVICLTMVEQFEEWARTREPPLFGVNPDARVMDIAASLGEPSEVACLDIGAGTGRNALPLARLGHRVHAIEVTAALGSQIAAAAGKEGLDIRVDLTDFLRGEIDLPAGGYRLVFLSEVVSHFRTKDDLRVLFERASLALAKGGILLFNVFLAVEGYTPDQFTREMSEMVWGTLFTRRELEEAAAGLPFVHESEEQVYAYEKRRQPEEHWPPTSWYSGWTQGQALFDLPEGCSPVDMRWMSFRRT